MKHVEQKWTVAVLVVCAFVFSLRAANGGASSRVPQSVTDAQYEMYIDAIY